MNTAPADEYDRQGVIGAGGFGTVYLGRKVSDGRQVALKTIQKTDEVSSERLLREVAMLQQLDHPNILRFEALLELADEFVIVTEYLAGGELYERLREQQRLSEAIARDVVAQLLSALRYAHERGVVHRDVKPENVMYVDKVLPQVKLIDWGTARPLPTAADHRLELNVSTDVGTVGYAAPEVFCNGSGDAQSYSQACDMWSVGVLTLELLSGAQPFLGVYDADTLAHGHRLVEPATWETLSPPAADFVKRLIEGRPELRMSAAQALQHPWIAATPGDDVSLVSQLLYISDVADRRQRDKLTRSLTRDSSPLRYRHTMTSSLSPSPLSSSSPSPSRLTS